MSTTTVPTDHPHRPTPADAHPAALGLAAICLGFLMITLDATIVNVALRPIVHSLGGSIATAQWVVNGYTLAFAVFLLSAGALADRLGARAGYLVGLLVFALGSALCSVASTLGMLIGARVLQGIGAAWLMPCSLALITHQFQEVAQRRRALAVWGGISGVGLALGPILGGVLTSAISWRAIFLVNLPVAALALVLLWRHVSETRRHRRPLDGPGQVLALLALSTLTGGFIVAGERGWGSGLALGLLGAGVIAAACFVLVQRRVRHPMIAPALFEAPAFVISVAIALLFNFCLYGGLFCLALALAEEHGLGPLDTGLAMLPMTVLVGTIAFLSGRIVTRIGEWRAIITGLSGGLIGALLVAIDPAHGPVVVLVLCTLPIGCVSMAMTAMTATAMAGAPTQHVGLASGVLNTARQTGGALGVAVLGALLAVTGTLSLHVAFGGVAVAYAIAIGLGLLGRRRERLAR